VRPAARPWPYLETRGHCCAAENSPQTTPNRRERWPPLTRTSAQTTKHRDWQVFQTPLPESNRRPLLTIRSFRQPVGTDGNGFGLFPPLSRSVDLRLIASGCNHGDFASPLTDLNRRPPPYHASSRQLVATNCKRFFRISGSLRLADLATGWPPFATTALQKGSHGSWSVEATAAGRGRR
jgi:hypothetical protein